MPEFDQWLGFLVRWSAIILAVAVAYIFVVGHVWRRLKQSTRVAVVMIAGNWKDYKEWRQWKARGGK